MPSFHHSVAVSPFCRCKVPLFCENYVRKFRSVTTINSKKDTQRQRKRQRQRCTETAKNQRLKGTAKRQRKNGNGMMETGHYTFVNDRDGDISLQACSPVIFQWLRTGGFGVQTPSILMMISIFSDKKYSPVWHAKLFMSFFCYLSFL